MCVCVCVSVRTDVSERRATRQVTDVCRAQQNTQADQDADNTGELKTNNLIINIQFLLHQHSNYIYKNLDHVISGHSGFPATIPEHNLTKFYVQLEIYHALFNVLN